MKTNEFKALITAVKNARTIEELDRLHEPVWDDKDSKAMTQRQLNIWFEARAAHIDEINGAKDTDYHFKKEGKTTMEKKNVAITETQTTQPETTQPSAKPETTQPSAKPVVFDIKDEQQVNKAIERISSKIDNIGKSYLSIVGDVARLKALSAWKITGNKNIYELCNERFGMARGTVHNLLTIFDKYGDKETFKLTDACAGMSLRQMLAEIAAEKRAELGVEEGGEGDGEGEGGNGGKSSKGKKDKGEVLLNIDFELVGDDWNGEAIAKKLAEQLNEIKDAFADGATVTLTITK